MSKRLRFAARKVARREYRAEVEAVYRLGGTAAVWRIVVARNRTVRCPACEGQGRDTSAPSTVSPLRAACSCCSGYGLLDPGKLRDLVPDVSPPIRGRRADLVIIDDDALKGADLG